MMIQMRQEAASKKVAELLASTSTPTAFVPLNRLKRGHNSSPRKNSSPRREGGLYEPYSCRSTDSNFSSLYSSRSMDSQSLREVIQSLEEKIREDQSSGLLNDHLSVSHTLTPDICSWNKKVAKKYKSRSRLPVNIMGCHQSAELIVARADERIRRQVTARELKEKHMEEVVRYIDHLIQLKLTRGERYTAQMEIQQKQTKWLTFIYLIRYALKVSPIANSIRHEITSTLKRDASARILQNKMTSWYERRILRRYVTFLNKAYDSFWRVRLQLSIIQKRNACKVIKIFLQEKSQNREVSRLVHTFLAGIRRIQGVIRSYLSCKVAKLRTLAILWDQLESAYILSVLAKRREEMGSQQSIRNKQLAIDEKLRIEMDKQASRWESTDKKFSKVLEAYRTSGELDKKVQESNIDVLKIPEHIRVRICNDLIRQKRKEHFEKVKEIQRKLKVSLQYSVEDAAALLRNPLVLGMRGNADDTSQKIVGTFYPFKLFSTLTDDDILERIKETHSQLKTFRVNGETVSLLKMNKSLMAGARRQGFVIQRQSSSRDYDKLFARTLSKSNSTQSEIYCQLAIEHLSTLNIIVGMFML